MKNTYTAADILATEYPQAPKVVSFEDITQLVRTHELVFQSRAGLLKPRYASAFNGQLILWSNAGADLLNIEPDDICILHAKQLIVWREGVAVDTLMVLPARVPKHTLADDVRVAMMDLGEELGLPATKVSALAMTAYMKVAKSPFVVSTPVDAQ